MGRMDVPESPAYNSAWSGMRELKPLLKVYIDAACELPDDTARDLSARAVNILSDKAVLDQGILLVGPRTSDGQPTISTMNHLRRQNQRVLVYLCARAGEVVAPMAVSYTRAGLDQFFMISSSADVADLVSCVRERALAPPSEAALESLKALEVGSWPSRLMLYAFRNSQSPVRLEQVAQRFGKALRTVEDWFQPPRIPMLVDVFRCGRFSHLMELKRMGVRGATERAHRLRFSSAASLLKWESRLQAKASCEQRLRTFVEQIPELHPLIADPDARG